MLIEAVAAGRPVVSTAFPHAIELLGDGTGLVVPQRDPAALEAALRRVLSEPGLADGLAEQAARKAPELLWARGGRPLPADRDRAASRPAWPRPRRSRVVTSPGRVESRPRVRPPAPRSPTRAGCTSTRDGTAPAARARLLRRRRGAGAGGRVPGAAAAELDDLREQYLTFVLAAQEPDGRFHNRRAVPTWAGPDTRVGRGLLGPRAVGSRHRGRRGRRSCATGRSRRSTAAPRLRSPHPRAMAFAALGAAEVLARACRGHAGARALITRGRATLIGRPAADAGVAVAGAAADLRQRGAARGAARRGRRAGRRPVARRGRAAPAGLAARRADPRRAPVGRPGRRRADRGAGPGVRPAADRGGRAGRRLRAGVRRSTGRRRAGPSGIELAAAWFLGANDSGTADATTRPPAAAATGWSASGATRTRARSRPWRCSRRCSRPGHCRAAARRTGRPVTRSASRGPTSRTDRRPGAGAGAAVRRPGTSSPTTAGPGPPGCCRGSSRCPRTRSEPA